MSVEIQVKGGTTTDTSGSDTTPWFVTGSAVNAFVDVQSSSDSISAGAERSQRIAKVYFDGTPTIAIKDRLTYDSATWEITSIINPGEFGATSHLSHTIVEAIEVNE